MPIPAELSDLEPLYVKRLGSFFLDIKLAACFDHGVFIRVEPGEGQVTVRYGEGPFFGEEVLWSGE